MLVFTTLNTGQSEMSRREDVADDIIDILEPLCKSGRFRIPAVDEGLFCNVKSYKNSGSFDVSDDSGKPVVMGLVCNDDSDSSAMWSGLEHAYSSIYKNNSVAARPELTPWLAITILPGLALYPAAAHWLADFERAVAWTILERMK